MMDDMGIFRTNIGIAHVGRPTDQRVLPDVMVDTGSEYNWVPRPMLEQLGIEEERVESFQAADGRVFQRPVGAARIFVAGRSAPAIVVFAEPGDMVLLGAVGLESLNLRVDLVLKELVPAGPVPVAAAA